MTQCASKRLLTQVTNSDVLLQVESLTPTSITNATLEIAKPHMNSSGMISKMTLASKPTATARLLARKRALLVMYNADVTG